jgi:hypothetical protein
MSSLVRRNFFTNSQPPGNVLPVPGLGSVISSSRRFEEVVFRTTVGWSRGLFTALVKPPFVPQELQVHTWIDFLLQTVYQIRS